jgi:integrase
MALLTLWAMFTGTNGLFARLAPENSASGSGLIMARKYGKGLRQRPPGTGKFYLSFTPRPGDKQREVCLNTRDYKTAIELAEEIRNRPQIVNIGTFEEDVQEYILYRQERRSMSPETARSVEEVTNFFFNFLGKKSTKEITKKDVEKWSNYLEAKPVQQATYTTYHARLRAFYQWLVKLGKVGENPFLDFSPHKIPPSQVAREAWIDKKEIKRILNACKKPQLKFVLFLGFHGLRKQEIVSSRPDWFDLKQQKINIPFFEAVVAGDIDEPDWERHFRTKNLRDRSVPLSKDFVKFLRKHPFRKDQHYCLEPQNGKGYGERYRWDFRKPLNKFFKDQGIALTTHGMRHSFASNCIMAGVPTFKVAAWLGNRERTVEVHYAHLATGKGDLDNVF